MATSCISSPASRAFAAAPVPRLPQPMSAIFMRSFPAANALRPMGRDPKSRPPAVMVEAFTKSRLVNLLSLKFMTAFFYGLLNAVTTLLMLIPCELLLQQEAPVILLTVTFLMMTHQPQM